MDQEIAFVLQIISNPIGYDLGLLGSMSIRSTDQLVWEVSWEQMLDGQRTDNYRTFQSPEEAATFFVLKRHELEIGIDFER